MSLSNPHLPLPFFRELMSSPMMKDFETTIYDDQTQALRVLFAAGLQNPDLRLPRPAGMSPATFVGHEGRTLLHEFSEGGDVPMVCEMLRFGSDVNAKDEHGDTPLMLAVGRLGIGRVTRESEGRTTDPQSGHEHFQRLGFVVRVLVEQHADVNVSWYDGFTPLQIVYGLRDWDLIELLLKHGANPFPPCHMPPSSDRGLAEGDKARFAALVQANPAGSPRPLRLCPCFSGKALVDCHQANAQPYPLHFTCPCKSGETYEECCSDREDVKYAERWNEEEQKIEVKSTLVMHGTIPSTEFNTPNPFGGRPLPLFGRLIEQLWAQRRIDAAYRYAVYHTKDMLKPRKDTKAERERVASDWNAAVDEYIALCMDTRPKINIERAAKVRSSCGALHRTCEAAGCNRMELRDVPQLMACSKCHLSVYCSRACQLRDWRRHKQMCCKSWQKEQDLQSDQELEAFMEENVAVGLQQAMQYATTTRTSPGQ